MVVLSSPTLYISERSLCFGMVSTYYVYTSSMILKVFSQQLLYTSLEQQGIKSKEEGLKTTQREEMQR